MGTLSILNVYEGDVKITYDTQNPAETIRAKRIIVDMLRRGYALLIEVDGAYQRALDFDERVGEYVIADFDPAYRPEIKPIPEDQEDGQEEKEPQDQEPQTEPKKRGRRRIGMEATNAVAIARSAGG